MAWISVHEQVFGGKLRSLSKEMDCSQNEAVGILIRLWLWGINNADKCGLIIGADKRDIAEILTVGKSESVEPQSAVEALITTGWIDCEDGALYIHDWEEWQEQWYKFKENKEKDAERKRKERAAKRMELQKGPGAEQPEENATVDSGGNEPGLPETEEDKDQEEPAPPKKSVAKTEYTKAFEEFWNIYPRKIGKGDCYKKYKARRNDGFSDEELLEAAKNYAKECRTKKTESQFIKHGKTFLSDSTPFEDYIPKKPVQAEGQKQEPNGSSNPFRR